MVAVEKTTEMVFHLSAKSFKIYMRVSHLNPGVSVPVLESRLSEFSGIDLEKGPPKLSQIVFGEDVFICLAMDRYISERKKVKNGKRKCKITG